MASALTYKLSSYACNLNPDDKKMYYSYLELLKCHDPLVIPIDLWKSGTSLKRTIPQTSRDQLILHFIIKPNGSNNERNEAFKNINSQQYLENGFIQDFRSFPLPSGISLIRAKTYHSQALSVQPVTPWAALSTNGQIIACNCDCAAGLGKCCIHVSALFQCAIAHCQREKESISQSITGDVIPVTSKPCSWNGPPKGRPVTVGKVADLNVLGPRKNSYSIRDVLPVSDDDYRNVNIELSTNTKSPVVLSMVPGYAAKYQPLATVYKIPPRLTSLYNPDFEGKDGLVISEECERLFQEQITCSAEEQEGLEILTRSQSKEPEWMGQRAGRITGTKIYRIVKLDLTAPLTKGMRNFLLQLCYPELITFKGNEATRYGLKKENEAVHKMVDKVASENSHFNFICDSVGLVVSTTYPFLAASPDRIFKCDCHGKGVVEVKCPFSLKGKVIKSQALTDKSFCLQVNSETGMLYMKKNHEYFFQVQLQLLVTVSFYAIFVVYTEHDLEYVLVERDEDAIELIKSKGKLFFLNYILPELVSKKFSSTKTPVILENPQIKSILSHPNLNQFICSCQNPSYSDETIICGNVDCTIRVFHKKCTGLKRISKTWKCKWCRAEALKKKRKEPIPTDHSGDTEKENNEQENGICDTSDKSTVPTKTSKRRNVLGTVNK